MNTCTWTTNHAQSMATPRSVKMPYSIHEKGSSCCPSSTVEPSRAVGSSDPVRGSYSEPVVECLRRNDFLTRSIMFLRFAAGKSARSMVGEAVNVDVDVVWIYGWKEQKDGEEKAN